MRKKWPAYAQPVPDPAGAGGFPGIRSRWSSTSFTAASPLGALVRPCSMSQTAETDKPISDPISARVRLQSVRRSDMRDAHVVMEPSLRQDVKNSQRLGVTTVRNNCSMPRPADMPNDLNTKGKRCKWWREYRQRTEDRKAFQQGKLAKSVGISQGALSDFENGHSNESEALHLICARLRLNPHYVETGRGEPEAAYPQEPPTEPEEWPFRSIRPAEIAKLNPIEFSYAENHLLMAIQEIKKARKKQGSG